QRHRVDWCAAATLGAVSMVLGVFLVLPYRGGDSEMTVVIGGSAREMAASGALMSWMRDIPVLRWVFFLGAPLVCILGMYASSLAGLGWAFRRGERKVEAGEFLLIACFAVTLVPFFLLAAPGFNELYPAYYAFVGISLLSARGLCILGSRWLKANARSPQRMGYFVAAWLVALSTLAFVPPHLLG